MRQNKFLFWSIRIPAVIWFVCIIAVALLVGFSTKWFTGTVNDTPFGKSNLFLILSLSFVGLGVLSFGIAVLSVVVQFLSDKKIIKFEKSFKGIVGSVVKTCLLFAFFPLVLLYSVSGMKNIFIKNKKKKEKKLKRKPTKFNVIFGRIIGIIVISITLLPLWGGGYWLIGIIVGHQLGYISENMTISGTGSMYPTFPKGHGKTLEELSKEIVSAPGMLPYPNGIVIGGKRFFGHQISREDIVTFANDKTKEMTQKLYGNASGYIKRVIGLAGDTIELRSGIVYLNDQPLKEPYTAKSRSTFGESYLSECKKVTVPENSVFVMGDNRKGSGDSREIGFINLKDVDHVLPLQSQKGNFDKNWRDTAKDFDESSKIKIDKQKYVDLLNEKRKEAKVQPVKYQTKLENSAAKRGAVILKYNDFSFEATKSGYTMGRAMSDSNYSNIVYGEAPTLGYYESEELIENQFEFPDTKKFLLHSDYQEIGIAEVEGEINGCPTQIVVLHFAGYVPPNYTKEVVDSWKKSLSGLREIQPSWERLKTYGEFYDKNKSDADRIMTIISVRIANISAIVTRMDKNQWLSTAEDEMINQDKALFDEQETLAKKLNSQ